MKEVSVARVIANATQVRLKSYMLSEPSMMSRSLRRLEAAESHSPAAHPPPAVYSPRRLRFVDVMAGKRTRLSEKLPMKLLTCF